MFEKINHKKCTGVLFCCYCTKYETCAKLHRFQILYISCGCSPKKLSLKMQQNCTGFKFFYISCSCSSKKQNLKMWQNCTGFIFCTFHHAVIHLRSQICKCCKIAQVSNFVHFMRLFTKVTKFENAFTKLHWFHILYISCSCHLLEERTKFENVFWLLVRVHVPCSVFGVNNHP